MHEVDLKQENGRKHVKILQDSVKAASCHVDQVPSLMQLAAFFPAQDSLEFGELSKEFSPPGLEQCFPWTSSQAVSSSFCCVTRGASSFPLAQSQSTASCPTLERCAAAVRK